MNTDRRWQWIYPSSTICVDPRTGWRGRHHLHRLRRDAVIDRADNNKLATLELFLIDITTETVVTFSDAGAYLPRRRRGRKVHPSTIWRWAKRGLRGHRLEVIKIGGQTCTSMEALQRFFDLLTGHGSPQTVHARSESEQQRIERELAKYGI